MDFSRLPEDVDQDEVDVAAERLRSRIRAAAALAGLTGEARVRTERREGGLWLIAEFVPNPETTTSEEVPP